MLRHVQEYIHTHIYVCVREYMHMYIHIYKCIHMDLYR